MEVDLIQNVARIARMRPLAGPWSVTGLVLAPVVVVLGTVGFQETIAHAITVRIIDQATTTRSDGPEGYQR